MFCQEKIVNGTCIILRMCIHIDRDDIKIKLLWPSLHCSQLPSATTRLITFETYQLDVMNNIIIKVYHICARCIIALID